MGGIRDAAESGGDFPQAGGADDEEVHIALTGGGAGGDGTEDQGEVDAFDRGESAAEFGGNAGGFEDDAAEVREERVGGIGAIVEAVAVAAGEDELLGGQRGEFLLEGRRAETGEAGEIAEVDFLIPTRE
jgi:hypothetical protein